MISLLLALLMFFIPIRVGASGETAKVHVSSPEPVEVVLEPEVTKARKVQPPPAPRPPPAGPTLYQASTTVLESKEHGPMLCLGGIMESYPPQCGDVPIDGWNWEEVGREESANGTTWGSYYVRGTYEDGTFGLLQTGSPRRERDATDYDFSPACSDRSVADASKTAQEDLEAATIYANKRDDVSAVWLSYVRIAAGKRIELLNAAFTGRLAHHRAEIRERWGGPLCVVRYETSRRELIRIQRRELGEMKEVSRLMLSTDINEVNSYVEIYLIVVSEELEAKLEKRFGELVRARGALEPVH
jgi:hypothetical protein